MPAVAQLETASDTEGLEGFGTNPHRNSRLGWTLPPNFERIKVAREKQPVAVVAKKAEAPAVLEPPVRPAAAVLIADYASLVEQIRNRVDELGITRLEMDHLSKMQPGYSAKILSRKHIRHLGMVSLGKTLAAIGCRLILVEDPAQTAVIKARLKPRERAVRLPKETP